MDLPGGDVVQDLRRAASFARAEGRRVAELVSPRGVVAQRYAGTLGGVAGGEPLAMLFVGREALARQFEVYYGTDPARRIEPREVLLRGSLPRLAVRARDLARFGGRADLVVSEALPGIPARDDDLLHYPMLDATLDVQRSVDEQIRRMRSRGQRSLARQVDRQGGYRHRVETGAEALSRYYSSLHAPYARARFGAWAQVEDLDVVRRMHGQHGRVLLVAASDRPDEPLCGALLHEVHPGTLTYESNGFALAGSPDPRTLAERTAALELAITAYARVHGFARIDLGYARGILSDGLFGHKRRLGCTFDVWPHSPLFRVRVRPGRRAAIFARFPLLTGRPGAWTAVLGHDAVMQAGGARACKSALKAYRLPGLRKVVVWAATASAALEQSFREVLDVPDGVEFRVDGG